MGASVGLVIGGGNIVRGVQLSKMGMERAGADYMGMLGTVINALALQDVLEKADLETRVMTAIAMESIAEPFIRRRAMRHFEKGRVVIFAAGTGNPYFSTDTAAALRAIQIHADVIVKATSVDGVYTADPKRDPEAKKYESISYRDVMLNELGVMDQTAITLCKENKLPIIVLNIHRHGEAARIGSRSHPADPVGCHPRAAAGSQRAAAQGAGEGRAQASRGGADRHPPRQNRCARPAQEAREDVRGRAEAGGEGASETPRRL